MGGHYNKAKTVAENLKMNGALLSRFDLVFILLDQVFAQLNRATSSRCRRMKIWIACCRSMCWHSMLPGARALHALVPIQSL